MRAIKQLGPWIYYLIGSALIALTAILVGRIVFGSLTGFFLAEATLGGVAGIKYRALALPGAVVAFVVCVGVEVVWKSRTFHREDSIFFLIIFLGTITFIVSAFTALLFKKKMDTD